MHEFYKYNENEESNATANTHVIYLSMGCFWEREPLFWKLKDVVYTEVGYANCISENPCCADALKDNIKHREVVKITYKNDDTLLEILNIFWNKHTIDLRDDFPVPNLYKSGIFYSNENQENLIKKSLIDITKSRILSKNFYPIATTISKIENYKKADEHHQQYLIKRNVFV